MTTGEASLSIRSARPGDAAGVTRIYNHYIGHSVATFEIRPVSEPIVARRMAGILERFPWLVAVADERLLGYAYATAWKPREAYAHTVETTIYLDHELCGRGLGERLYRRLLTELEAMNVHAALGGIALP
ncbi:MAG: GNAT family N-acetyltransferase, partial [Candidatus Competibacterales bacterium]|nr:GNAT family N-acetyltransferase [Candidatus Competibacterales bacterium]